MDATDRLRLLTLERSLGNRNAELETRSPSEPEEDTRGRVDHGTSLTSTNVNARQGCRTEMMTQVLCFVTNRIRGDSLNLGLNMGYEKPYFGGMSK